MNFIRTGPREGGLNLSRRVREDDSEWVANRLPDHASSLEAAQLLAIVGEARFAGSSSLRLGRR
jgi:hypothetical protein